MDRRERKLAATKWILDNWLGREKIIPHIDKDGQFYDEVWTPIRFRESDGKLIIRGSYQYFSLYA